MRDYPLTRRARLSEPPQTTSDEFTSGPRWYGPLVRLRFLLAGVYLLAAVLLVGLPLLNSPLTPANLFPVAIIGFILFAGQAMLLAGAPHLHWPRKPRPRHVFISLFAGALAAGALSFGFVATTISLFGSTMKEAFPNTHYGAFSDAPDSWPLLYVLIGLPWFFWLIVFSVLWAARWTKGFGQMYRLLVAGTCVELLFTVPVDVFVRRRTHCWCGEGTFFALAIGITTAFWTFGPGVALLFLSVRTRRLERTKRCVQCGYDLRGLPEPRCPECGTPFQLESDRNEHRDAKTPR
jgi:hypothetical protein